MPPRQQYQLHRYAARPSSLAPADKSSRSALAKRVAAANERVARRTPAKVSKGFIADLKSLTSLWAAQAGRMEASAGAKLITDAAARRARVETLRRVAKALRELIEGEGV